MSDPLRMSVADTALLVIDVQQRLLDLIPASQTVVRNVGFLVDAAGLLGIPIQATEQYPKGLGPTSAALVGRLPRPADKVAFSCCAVPGLVGALHQDARPKVLLAGIETHVCVLLTCLDLLALGFRVYVAADAVASRSPVDHEFALRRMEKAGAVLTTSEAAVFEWAGGADCPQFKAVSRLVRERMNQPGPAAPGNAPSGKDVSAERA